MIILSTRYSDTDLKILDELIKHLKLDNKKIIIFNSALEHTMKIEGNLNRLDYFVYKNNKLPNKGELKKMEEDMYKDLRNRKEVNLKIKNNSKSK